MAFVFFLGGPALGVDGAPGRGRCERDGPRGNGPLRSADGRRRCGRARHPRVETERGEDLTARRGQGLEAARELLAAEVDLFATSPVRLRLERELELVRAPLGDLAHGGR